MKAADIPDDLFLEGIRELSVQAPWASPSSPRWVMRYQIDAWLSGRLGIEIPWKVSLAKARKLIKQGRLNGCACGCRGDFELPSRSVA